MSTGYASAELTTPPQATTTVRPPERAPQGARTRMLLVHGLANTGRTWDRFIEHGRHGWEPWTAELPWRGEGQAMGRRRGDLLAAADQALAAVPGGAQVVVGHSFGANVLLELLNAQLARDGDPFADYGMRALVLVAPFFRSRAEEFDWDTISYYLNDFHRILEEGIRVRAHARLTPQTRRAMAQRVRDQVGPHGWMRFFELYLATPQLRTELFTLPCLVVAGMDDFAAHPNEASALAAALPNAVFHPMPECGHFPMIERPAELAAVVDDFLKTGAGISPGGGYESEQRGSTIDG